MTTPVSNHEAALTDGQLIDGKAIALKSRQALKERVSAFVASGHPVPKLCVLRVGADAASEVYVRNKAKACVEVGMQSEVLHLPTATAQEVLSWVQRWNADSTVTGILVQLPLPAGIDERAVIDAIAPDKDVDAFAAEHVGRLSQGRAVLQPCTPLGVMKLIATVQADISGLHAVVVGRSLIVGKPVAQMLLNASATVTICHSKTRDVAEHVRRADIVVAALGRANFVRGEWIKPGAIVIDVGINRDSSGALVGDVEFDEAKRRARAITPVPGGVGPMTIAMLLENTFVAAQSRVSSSRKS